LLSPARVNPKRNQSVSLLSKRLRSCVIEDRPKLDKIYIKMERYPRFLNIPLCEVVDEEYVRDYVLKAKDGTEKSFTKKELGITLAKGVSAKVKGAAAEVITMYGPEMLPKVAKMHFKTAGEVLAATASK
jgi:hypothetical protein